MKKTILLLSLTSVISLACQEESPEVLIPFFFDNDCQITDLTEVEGLSQGCFLPFLEESFSNNDFGWTVGSGQEYNREVDSGVLKVETDDNSTGIYGSSAEVEGFRNLENFQLDVDFRIQDITNGYSDEYNLIIWGSNEELDKFHGLAFKGNGYYVFYKWDSGFSTDFHSGTVASNAFVSNNYSTLVVRKYEGEYYFFLNDELLASVPFQDIFGDVIYFGTGPGNELWVDQVKLNSIF